MTQLLGILAVAALFAVFGLCRRERGDHHEHARCACGVRSAGCPACTPGHPTSESTHESP